MPSFTLSHNDSDQVSLPPEAPGPPVGFPRPGGTTVYVFLNYVGVFLGVAAKYFIQYSHGGPDSFNWVTLVSSVILSAVIYPFVYKKVCDPRLSGGVQYFISFQHGFFFQTLLEEIQRTSL